MKPKFLLIGAISSLALAACDDKKEVVKTSTAPPKAVVKTKAIRSTETVKHKPAPPEPTPADEPEPQSAEVLSEDITPATPPAAAPAPPVQTGRGQAQTAEERKAQATQRMTTMLTQSDANGDGRIAQDEMRGPMQRRFATADKNGDGYLDAAEQQTMAEEMSDQMGQVGNRRGGGGGGGPGGGGRRGGGGGGGGGR